MNSSEIKKLVKRYRSEFDVRDVTLHSLEAVFHRQGFMIVEFNPVLNDPDTAVVIKNLGLSDLILHSKGFLYTDNNYRLVFVNDRLNDEERKIVLAHEEGHYYCGHAFTRSVAGYSVIEEQEANEFTHYLLLQESIISRLKNSAARHKKLLIAGAAAAGISIGGGVASREYHDRQLYEGEYYVTAHGEKYHLENCVTIQGHETRRLTKEDVESGKYEPCSVCQPEK